MENHVIKIRTPVPVHVQRVAVLATYPGNPVIPQRTEITLSIVDPDVISLKVDDREYVFVTIAVHSPPAVFWTEDQEAYKQTLGGVPRLVGASMVAYLISQFHDVWAFDYWRRKTRGRFLLVRNNLSTMVSQFIDTIVFISLAFGGLLPLSAMLTMVVGQIVVKWVIAWLDTPFILLGVRIMGPPLKTALPYDDELL